MPSNHDQPWGLTVPGRPDTPSEGAAQQYTRIGPYESQHVKTFDNGTCLEFGPDDPVDEFEQGHPFVNQTALIDTVIRDIRASRQRYEGPNTRPTFNEVGSDFTTAEADPFANFRTQPPEQHILGVYQLESGTYAQVPSRYASCGSLISTHSLTNKSDLRGGGHPGSVDSRFGQGGKITYPALPRRDQSRNGRGRVKQPSRMHIGANYKQRTPQVSPHDMSLDQASQASGMMGLGSNFDKPARNHNRNLAILAGNISYFPGQAHSFPGFMGPVVSFPPGFVGNFAHQPGNFVVQADNFVSNSGAPGNFVNGLATNYPTERGDCFEQDHVSVRQRSASHTSSSSSSTVPFPRLSPEPIMSRYGQHDGYGNVYHSTGTFYTMGPFSGYPPPIGLRSLNQPNMAFDNFPGGGMLNSGPFKIGSPVMTTRVSEGETIGKLSFEKLPGGGLSTASPITKYHSTGETNKLGRQLPSRIPYENLPQIVCLRREGDRKPFQDIRPDGIKSPKDTPTYEEYVHRQAQYDRNGPRFPQPESGYQGSMQSGALAKSSPTQSSPSLFARYLDELNVMSEELGHKCLEGDQQGGHSHLQAQFGVPIPVAPPGPSLHHIAEAEPQRGRSRIREDRTRIARRHPSFLDQMPVPSQDLQQGMSAPNNISMAQDPLPHQEAVAAGQVLTIPRKPLSLASPIHLVNDSKLREKGASKTEGAKAEETKKVDPKGTQISSWEITAGQIETGQSTIYPTRARVNPIISDISLARSFSQVAFLTPNHSTERKASGFGEGTRIGQLGRTLASVSMPGSRTASPLQHPGNPRTPDDQIGLVGYDSNTGDVNTGEPIIRGPFTSNFGIRGRRRLFER